MQAVRCFEHEGLRQVAVCVRVCIGRDGKETRKVKVERFRREGLEVWEGDLYCRMALQMLNEHSVGEGTPLRFGLLPVRAHQLSGELTRQFPSLN